MYLLNALDELWYYVESIVLLSLYIRKSIEICQYNAFIVRAFPLLCFGNGNRYRQSCGEPLSRRVLTNTRWGLWVTCKGSFLYVGFVTLYSEEDYTIQRRGLNGYRGGTGLYSFSFDFIDIILAVNQN